MKEFSIAKLPRLRAAMDHSLRSMRPHRKQWQATWERIMGPHYGPPHECSQGRTPVNLIERAHSTYLRLLAASAPQVLAVPKMPAARAAALDIEAVLNVELAKLQAEHELRRWVANAMHGLGVMKVGWVDSGRKSRPIKGQAYPLGRISLRAVNLDDYVHDMTARDLESITFIGHKYRIPFEEAREQAENREAAAALKPTPLSNVGPTGDRTLEAVGRGAVGEEEFEDHVELWCIYLPAYNVQVTIPVEETSAPPLSIVPWSGPEGGPFHHLFFTEIPNNTMPLPPSMAWLDLHDLANAMYRKIGSQAEESKTVLAYQEGYDEEAERIVNTGDMGTVAVSNIDAFKSVSFNGPDQSVLALLERTLDHFNSQSGNPDLLAGIAPGAPTATQESLMAQAAQGRVGDMRDIVYDRTKRVYEHLAWHVLNDPDPDKVYRATRKLPNLPYDVEVELGPEPIPGRQAMSRFQAFDLVNFQLVPYSMQRKTPEQRLAEIDQTMMNIIIPLAPERANVPGYLGLRAKLSNMPEYLELVQDGTLPAQAQQPSQGNDRRQSPVTTRTNIRQSVSAGPTGSGKSIVAAQSALSAAGRTDNSGRINAT